MKKLVIIFTVFILLLTTLFAQQKEAEKIRSYESKKKSPTKAVVYSCLIPSLGLGHAYTKNWGPGLLFTGARLGCLVICGSGLKSEESFSSYCHNGNCETTKYIDTKVTNRTLYNIGWIGFVAVTVWQMIDASKQVKKYNNNFCIFNSPNTILFLINNRS